MPSGSPSLCHRLPESLRPSRLARLTSLMPLNSSFLRVVALSVYPPAGLGTQDLVSSTSPHYPCPPTLRLPGGRVRILRPHHLHGSYVCIPSRGAGPLRGERREMRVECPRQKDPTVGPNHSTFHSGAGENSVFFKSLCTPASARKVASDIRLTRTTPPHVATGPVSLTSQAQLEEHDVVRATTIEARERLATPCHAKTPASSAYLPPFSRPEPSGSCTARPCCRRSW